MTQDIRKYLEDIEGSILRVRRAVSTKYETAAVTARAEGGPALLFENIEGSPYRMATNLVGTRERFAMALGTGVDSIHIRMLNAIDAVPPPHTRTAAAFADNSSTTIGEMPIVTHFEKEPGPFIASSVVFAANPDTGTQNSSFHRMMPLDERNLTMRMVEGRHLHRCFMHATEHGEDLKVAVVVGVHPAILIAGAYQAGWGQEEMGVAGALLNGLEMASLQWSGLSVPASAEIVMEGRILQDTTHEEWMVEMLQTYDYRREQPVFMLERLHHRNNPIYHDILPGYGEHKLLMGMPVESKINGSLRGAAPNISAVLSRGGCNWMHAVVQIQKGPKTDVPDIIRRTFEAHRSLKRVVVVDHDIDIQDAASVEYALATRFQADRDLIVMRDMRGSSLDPSSDQKNLKTAKMGMDATIPLDKRPEGFELALIPGMESVQLDDYVA